MFFCIAAGGIGLLSVAKTMMKCQFSKILPDKVTPQFTTSFVLMLSGGNLIGRLFWGVVSDRIGRKKTFQVFTVTSVPLFLSLPTLITMVNLNPSIFLINSFILVTVTLVSIMGGVYATLPAYEADLFGAKYVGSNHGKMLLASTSAGIKFIYIYTSLHSSFYIHIYLYLYSSFRWALDHATNLPVL